MHIHGLPRSNPQPQSPEQKTCSGFLRCMNIKEASHEALWVFGQFSLTGLLHLHLVPAQLISPQASSSITMTTRLYLACHSLAKSAPMTSLIYSSPSGITILLLLDDTMIIHFFLFLWPNLWHVEIPRLGVE